MTTSYGSTTGSAILANGSATAVVAGLSQDTTYHYRAVDVDGNTTIDGSDMTFITTYTPVTVTTTAVDTITSTSAHLNASFTSPTGNPHILFVYGPTTSYGSTTGVATIVEGTSVTFAVTGLTPNTLYHYKPIDVDFNVTTPGADMTFTTATAVTLSTPTPSAITSASATISVNYSGVPVDLSGMTATFFKLQYGTTTSYGSTAAQANSDFVSFNSSGVFTKTLTGLTSGTTYHYRIVTVHQPGNTNEVDSPDATFTTL